MDGPPSPLSAHASSVSSRVHDRRIEPPLPVTGAAP